MKTATHPVRKWAPLALAIVLALVLRVVLLGSKSLWLDEIWSVGIARLNWPNLGWSILHQDPNMSLYYALLHVWMSIGSTEAVVRALSVVFGVATIPVVYALGVRLHSKAAGLCAALLLAVNGFHIQWSQEVRSYSMAVFLVSLSSLLFVKLRFEPTRWTRVAFILVSALAVYAHLYALFVLVAQAASMLFVPGRRLWRQTWTEIACAGLLTMPLLLLVTHRAKDPMVPFNWVPRPGLHDVTEVFHRLSGSPEIIGQPGGRILPLLFLMLCAMAVIGGFRRPSGKPGNIIPWDQQLLLWWLFLPIAAVLVISLHQPMFHPRYFAICLPPLALLAAGGVLTLGTKPRILCCMVLVLTCMGAETMRYYLFRHQYREWRTVTSNILKGEQKGDAMLFCIGPGRLLFDYYQRHYFTSTGFTPEILYPHDENLRDPKALAYLPPFNESELADEIRRHDRVWLVLYGDQFPAPANVKGKLQSILSAEYSKSEEESIGTVRVGLYSRKLAGQSAN